MGQGHSSKVRKREVPPDAESLHRQNYIHRLGIQNNKKSASFSCAPTGHHEDPGQFETNCRKYASFSNSGQFESSISGPSEPLCRITCMKESEDSSDSSEDGIISPETDVIMKDPIRHQADFRVSYLRKLSYEKVWVPVSQRPAKHQTVIVFDWDDTLLCTSYLSQCAGQPLLPSVEQQLRAIESTAKRLLEMAVRLGHTFIITNAMEGWVEDSSARYVPGLLPVLQKSRVISARSRWEVQYPDEVHQWKMNTFLEVQRQLDSQIITNLNSIGDSDFEMDAIHVMGKEFAQAFVKTVKLKPNPSPADLLKQLELVEMKFEQIVLNARNMSIGLERTN